MIQEYSGKKFPAKKMLVFSSVSSNVFRPSQTAGVAVLLSFTVQHSAA